MNFNLRLAQGILLALCLGAGGTALAAEPPDGEAGLAFADHLFAQDDYYRAITEYERFIFANPGHVQLPQAKLQIARCYLKGQKRDTAGTLLIALQEADPNTVIGKQATLLLAETYYQQQNYNQAIDVLERFLKTAPVDPLADEARIKLGLCYLRFGNSRWAVDTFQSVASNAPLRGQAANLARAAPRYDDLPQKSPWLAAGLSAVLPGAGQLYVKRPMDAAISLALNAVLILATLESFDKEIYVLGGTLAFVEAGWWAGNIYNAANGAHKYNRHQKDTFFDHLNIQYGPLNTVRAPDAPAPVAPALALNIQF